MANWQLDGCCKKDQLAFVITVGAFIFAILLLWKTPLLLPFKLITVYLHELSHAIACKLTCGHVESIQVKADEGGATRTRGGVPWIILPAGYLGSSFWGMVLVIMSVDKLAVQIATGCLIASLLIVLVLAKNWTLRFLCIGFVIFLGVVWALQLTTVVHILRYCVLFIGVMNGLFSIYDIYDDTISRRVHSSDAEKFAEICPCCNGCGWGVVWGFISIAFLLVAVYIALVILA